MIEGSCISAKCGTSPHYFYHRCKSYVYIAGQQTALVGMPVTPLPHALEEVVGVGGVKIGGVGAEGIGGAVGDAGES